MHRIMAVTALVLSLSLVGVGELQAQRSGFIIGFGLGAGLTAISGGDTKGAVATDFKIGAQVNPSVQVYYLGRSNWFDAGNLVIAGISAVGVTYLPSPKVQLSGGVGVFSWSDFYVGVELGDAEVATSASFGLTGGVGYEFADLWLLDIAVTYGKPDGVSVWEMRAGISILSH